MRLLYSLLALCAISFAASLGELREKPTGYARDLFLLDFIKGAQTKEEAYEAYFLTQNPKSAHSSRLLTKTTSKKLSKLFDCMDSNITRALTKSPECAALGVNYKKISSALLEGFKEPVALAALIEQDSPRKASKINLLTKIASKENALDEAAIEAYFEVSKEFRRAFFDKETDDKELEILANSKNLKRLIKWVLFDGKTETLQKSLANLECREGLDGEALFFLGLVKLKEKRDSIDCFVGSSKVSKKEQDRDRGLFWAYLASKNEEFLKKAASSNDFNFYSFLAKERAGQKPPPIFFLTSGQKEPYAEDNASEPFFWASFRKDVQSANGEKLLRIAGMAERLKDGEAYAAYVAEKARGYKKDIFLLPYKEAFADFNETQKTLLHAIGRQESLFVPAVVSSAYAIGVMQIIPILGEELAVKRGEKLNFFDLFEPAKNISYAATHFKWLESKVSHPTLIAISYNAGYGFFRRIEKEGLFGFNDERINDYEPFWSIENIPYDETREYAKKVSLNYAVYSEKFGDRVSLSELLESLVTHRRKSLRALAQ